MKKLLNWIKRFLTKKKTPENKKQTITEDIFSGLTKIPLDGVNIVWEDNRWDGYLQGLCFVPSINEFRYFVNKSEDYIDYVDDYYKYEAELKAGEIIPEDVECYDPFHPNYEKEWKRNRKFVLYEVSTENLKKLVFRNFLWQQFVGIHCNYHNGIRLNRIIKEYFSKHFEKYSPKEKISCFEKWKDENTENLFSTPKEYFQESEFTKETYEQRMEVWRKNSNYFKTSDI